MPANPVPFPFHHAQTVNCRPFVKRQVQKFINSQYLTACHLMRKIVRFPFHNGPMSLSIYVSAFSFFGEKKCMLLIHMYFLFANIPNSTVGKEKERK